MAEWLLNELNRPENWLPVDQRTSDDSIREYRRPDQSDEVIRVYYLPDASTEDLSNTMKLIQRRTRNGCVFYCTTPKALVVRGTSYQVAQAEQLIKDQKAPQ